MNNITTLIVINEEMGIGKLNWEEVAMKSVNLKRWGTALL